MKILALFIFTFLGSSLFAQESADTIKKGFEVKIEAYEKKCDCYEITILKEEAIGPNYSKIEMLPEALGLNGGVAALKKNPSQLDNKTFTLKKDLKLLSDEEVEKLGL